MNHDSVIALYDYVPTSVTNPIEIGALRASDAATTWQDDVVTALDRGSRAILCGDIQNLDAVIDDILVLRTEFLNARLALMIHWSQALSTEKPSRFSAAFEKTYVVVDRALSQPELQLLQHRWAGEWIFIPTVDINWHTWIPENLLPSRRGTVTILAPRNLPRPAARNFLTADEILLNISEFSIRHPLIHFRPVSPEWMMSSELGPWNQGDRDYSLLSVLHDSRQETNYARSIVIPFRWSGNDAELKRLQQCVDSAFTTFPLEDTEVIVVVDRLVCADRLTAEKMGLLRPHTVIAEHLRTRLSDDWRASFIRNCGASLARRSSEAFLFLDADTVIENVDSVRNVAMNSQIEFFYPKGAYSLFGVRRELFERVGGFADAFSKYGGEISYAIWRASKTKAPAQILSRDVIRPLREPASSDDFAFKIRRLQRSSNLMFRMTLDPKVHAQFYASMGPGVWIRAAATRAVASPYARPIFALLVFVLTMLETNNRIAYLRGFYDDAFWKMKRPLFRLLSYIKQPTVSRERES